MPGFGTGRDIFWLRSIEAALFRGPVSAADLTFAQRFRRVLQRMSNPKPHYDYKFGSVLSAQTFAKEPAATGCECLSQDTTAPYSALRGCRRGPMSAPTRRPQSGPT